MRIATANVNGIRAAARKGGILWLNASGADLACLQETRAPMAVVADLLDGWRVALDESDFAGRAGAAIAARGKLRDVVIGMPGIPRERPEHTGRWVEATCDGPGGEPLRVVSVYLHSGRVETPSMDHKYEFLEAMTARLVTLAADHALVLVAGDVNIAHTERDIRNWRGNRASAGFLPEERAYLDRWVDSGWIDVHRALSGERDGPYTWWSQRGKAFDNDTGWRIDYQYATPRLAGLATEARVERAPSWDARWSDHAPLVVDYADGSPR